MTATLIKLFNLNAGVTTNDYETWAMATALPMLRGLQSVEECSVHRAGGVEGRKADLPFAYAEIVKVRDLESFDREMAGLPGRRVTEEFRAFSSDPQFLVCQPIED